MSTLSAVEYPVPLLCFGGGYLDAGSRHSGAIAQLEYKWGDYFWYRFRPQATLMVPEFRSVFVGAGIGIELFFAERLIFSPNFIPGVYYRGGKGKNLGCPIEFRSALELAYEFRNRTRLGAQFSHISNGHLSSKNPGMNAIMFFLAIPLCAR